jgi:hypothetical protein
MPVDSIIRVSFQSNIGAGQAVNRALVGHADKSAARGPFKRVATAVYSCSDGSDLEVGEAIAQLGSVLQDYATSLDFVSISLVRKQ